MVVIMLNINEARRHQTEIVMRENAIGTEELAFCIGKEPEDMERLLGLKGGKFPDALARQIEQTFSKPKFWLDSGAADNGSGNNFDLFG